MITRRARSQFGTILAAAEMKALCVVTCHDIKTGKPEQVLCLHQLENGVQTYLPLAKLFKGNPLHEITPPGASKSVLI